jgi:hypothetical protein
MRDLQVRRGRGHDYSSPTIRIGRSQFDRSHGHLTTFDASYIIPILLDEVYPGDTFRMNVNGISRIFSPLDAPIFDNIELCFDFFYCPTRILWNNFEEMLGQHDDAGAQDTTYTVPTMQSGGTVAHGVGTAWARLAGYMGLPEGLQTGLVNISAVPFRMYNFCYNEFYRDQNIIDEAPNNRGDSADPPSHYSLYKSAKRHDYFTSMLPYLQKGAAVTVAIGTTASVRAPSGVVVGGNPVIGADVDTTWRELDSDAARVDLSATLGNSANALYADLSTATGVNINDLRYAIATQRALEIDARAGTRFTEYVRAHFGVSVPDYRLQRPEYLGGGKSYINVSPVANTSATATEDQGELRGVGTGVIQNIGWAKSFVEHGYVMGFVRARGDITYFQGVDKLWTRSSKWDFYVPSLAMLGEQSVLNKELFVSNSAATDDATIGYQERWAELRYKKSLITDKMNPDVAGSLSFWHLAEDFSSLPALNQTFIEDQTPMSRVTTVDSEPDFMMALWFDYKCARPLPVRSIPALTGHL